MSPLRPDLVDCWIFRVGEPAGGDGASEPPTDSAATAAGTETVEILLIRRSPGRILPGLWQCVSGSVELKERVALAALREVEEETGFGPDAIEAFFDLDLVNQFHEPSVDAVVLSAVFAIRVRSGIEPVLSHEHTAFRWLPLDDAWREVIWPGYREAIERIRDHLMEPDRASWFRLDPGDGLRLADS